MEHVDHLPVLALWPLASLTTSVPFLTTALSPHCFTPSKLQLLFLVTHPAGIVLPFPPPFPRYLNKSSAFMVGLVFTE